MINPYEQDIWIQHTTRGYCNSIHWTKAWCNRRKGHVGKHWAFGIGRPALTWSQEDEYPKPTH